jgi:DNA-binding MarR family transcriptional regulator
VTLPQLRLDNQLCFLFHRISRELTAAYRPRLEDLGLTYPQYLVMLVLWETDGLTVGQIGQRLALDSATLSPLLRRLAEAGLVQRRRETADERRVTIHLTPGGRALEARAAQIPAELAARVAADHAEYVELRERLEHLLRRIAEQRAQDHAADNAIPADSSTP